MQGTGVGKREQWAYLPASPIRRRVLPFTLLALACFIGPATHAGPAATLCPTGPSEHGGGLNGCGCHFNRKTGECHCHRPRACGCECQPSTC